MSHFQQDLSRGITLAARQRGYDPDEALQHFADTMLDLNDLLDQDKAGPVFVTDEAVLSVMEVWRDDIKADFFNHRANPETGILLVRQIRQLHKGSPFPEVIDPESGEAAPGALNPFDKKAIGRLWDSQTRLMGMLLRGVMRQFKGLKAELDADGCAALEWGGTLQVKEVPLERVQAELSTAWGAVIRRLTYELQTFRPVRKRRTNEEFFVCTHELARGAGGNDR